MTGEGAMFADNAENASTIPFYKADAEHAVYSELLLTSPDSNLLIPPVGGCDLAVTYMGRAMGTVIPTGTIVLLKAIDRDAIIPGGEYVVVCRKIVTLRIVRAADVSGKWRLVAGDRDAFDDIVVNVSDIKAVYKVKAKIIINN